MRKLFALALTTVALALPLAGFAQPSCSTGLCLQQVSCPAGQSTVLSGVVYAPNGTDPLPDVLVYVPNAAIPAFTAGVSCPAVGAPPDGQPIVGTSTNTDGTFTISNVPVGANIPLVIQSGRWRRQLVVPSTTACATTKYYAQMPASQSQGEIPRFAIATGSADQVECVLLKVGISPSEFTDPSGSGRINLYAGSGSPGSTVSSATPSETALMGNLATLNSYDVLMLPCEGGAYPAAKNSTEYANLIAYANAGGRVYSSHFSYQWMYDNPPFNTVANWDVNQAVPSAVSSASNPPYTLPATVDQTFAAGKTLAQWMLLPAIGASSTLGQIGVSTVKHDLDGVIAPTQSWLTLNTAMGTDLAPVMQFVFDAPVGGAAGQQCGRVLYNEYHVEAGGGAGKTFPAECDVTAPMTAQEKLLEYSLFELTNDGGAATLTPASADFGSQPIGFNSAPQTFIWTNKSTFTASPTLLQASGDFSVVGTPCASVAASASCNINVVFNPTATGARSGLLSVGSGGTTLTATLTGSGIPDLVISTTSIAFGSLDVGASATQSIAITNSASGPVAVPPLVTSGDFSVGTNCPSLIPALGTCTISVTFKPTVFGPRTGALTVNSTNPAYPGTPTVLTGNGLDFTFVLSPTSGTVIAGISIGTGLTTTPLAGFAGNLTLTCSDPAAGSVCTLGSNGFTANAVVATSVNISTTSKYTVIGYSGFPGYLWIVAALSGSLLWWKRRSTRPLLRAGLFILLLAAGSIAITGCAGHLPAQNANATVPGNYTYTITATDGIITHSTTYSLNVTAQ